MNSEKETDIQNKIADSLIELMQKEPFDEIQISEICNLSFVSRATYYRYFSGRNSKEDVLFYRLSTKFFTRYRYLENKDAFHTKSEKLLFVLDMIERDKFVFKYLIDNDMLSILLKYATGTTFLDYVPETEDDYYYQCYRSFGWFGVVYTWIKSGFKDSKEVVIQKFTDEQSKKIR